VTLAKLGEFYHWRWIPGEEAEVCESVRRQAANPELNLAFCDAVRLVDVIHTALCGGRDCEDCLDDQECRKRKEA
jgi:hypothetical protein